ncbi:Vsp/OspC family lipoprotein [Borrelia venezuelensis]|uniref:Vsp/OspC family lipoprotein n=1 Tax=Borrelia venezuelensis TaxID=1653839 RepID=UPI003D9B53FA
MKRITLCALLMTLFLLSSCNTSGKNLKDDEVAKSDGTVIDLAKITKNITDTVAFAKSVKEVHSLVKSIDTLANAIGKKIKNDDDGFDTESNKNGSLLAGTLQLIFAVGTKLEALAKIAGISDELKGKVTAAKTENTSLIAKLKGGDANLGKHDATDEHAKEAIDKTNKPNGDKGVAELKKLNTAIDALLKAAEAAVTAAINELTTTTKS